ncbi:conserved hypothetical protein [Frankia canadensis]|uniref:Protein kinase domain-containing protein n=1 Tax=Frankia canadensis TaxID=1836972 RepID=A0A2I2KZV0_9ACTN|nr:serine/threonine protein kinase [Frankia canadensis]SNQ51188.1 conserved hypothetical protein [Frankia canadensis]SOU58478.1 conserved hypothetical protein [Frankia canadensis]
MADVESLSFCRPDGSRVEWEVEMAPGPADETRNFRTRHGRYQNFPLAIRYAIGGESAEFALENAIAMGLRMLRRFDVDRMWPWEEKPRRYPWELSRLVGYDVDCDQPFVITIEFGMPLAGLRSSGTAGSLSSPDDLRAFASGLARGLVVLDRLGVVHRQVRDNTVHWDARSRLVQINRFEYARRVGEPRGRLAQVRVPGERTARDWEAPEQISGGGLVDARDDVFSVGCAILSVTAHGLRLGTDGLPDIAASGIPSLANVLRGVFSPVASRPEAAELLGRLGNAIAPGDLPRPETDGFGEGRAEYDRIVVSKNPSWSAFAVSEPPPGPRPPVSPEPSSPGPGPSGPSGPSAPVGPTGPQRRPRRARRGRR